MRVSRFSTGLIRSIRYGARPIMSIASSRARNRLTFSAGADQIQTPFLRGTRARARSRRTSSSREIIEIANDALPTAIFCQKPRRRGDQLSLVIRIDHLAAIDAADLNQHRRLKVEPALVV